MKAETLIRRYPLWLIRVLRVALFVGILTLSARITLHIPGTPVPITGQTWAVRLTGMVLGLIEGLLSVGGCRRNPCWPAPGC